MTKGKLYEMLKITDSDGWVSRIRSPLLDEAKKEFPSDFDEKYKEMLFSERNIVLSRDRWIWFIKWFGSEEKPHE